MGQFNCQIVRDFKVHELLAEANLQATLHVLDTSYKTVHVTVHPMCAVCACAQKQRATSMCEAVKTTGDHFSLLPPLSLSPRLLLSPTLCTRRNGMMKEARNGKVRMTIHGGLVTAQCLPVLTVDRAITAARS